jgi:hypothetical protein
MKKIVSMVVCATVVLLAAGVVMAGEGKGKAKGEGKGKEACKKGDFFVTADTDKDGKISLAEFTAACAGKKDVEAKFAAMDADKDGFVTKEEMKTCKGKGEKKEKKEKKGADAPAPVAPVAPAAE